MRAEVWEDGANADLAADWLEVISRDVTHRKIGGRQRRRGP